MNTQEVKFSPASFFTAQEVRRQAELLRAEQAAWIFRGIFRSAAAGYSRLATYGAKINTAYRTPKALY